MMLMRLEQWNFSRVPRGLHRLSFLPKPFKVIKKKTPGRRSLFTYLFIYLFTNNLPALGIILQVG